MAMVASNDMSEDMCHDVVVLTGRYLTMAELAGVYELREGRIGGCGPVYYQKGKEDGKEAYIFRAKYDWVVEHDFGGDIEQSNLMMVSNSTSCSTPCKCFSNESLFLPITRT